MLPYVKSCLFYLEYFTGNNPYCSVVLQVLDLTIFTALGFDLACEYLDMVLIGFFYVIRKLAHKNTLTLIGESFKWVFPLCFITMNRRA